MNSFVLVSYPVGLGGAHHPPTKLHTRWQGAFKVVKVQGDEYTLLNLVTTKQSKHHKTQLGPFKWDKPGEPIEIAARDQDEYLIDEIMEHQGDFKKKHTLSFRIRWVGLDALHDTWGTWRELRNTEALHKYMGMKNISRRDFWRRGRTTSKQKFFISACLCYRILYKTCRMIFSLTSVSLGLHRPILAVCFLFATSIYT